MMRSLLALVAALTLQVACQAGIVVKSVVVKDVFSGVGDSQQDITLQIRAGSDGTNPDVGGFAFSLMPTVQPAAFSVVTVPSSPPTNSWQTLFDLSFDPTGVPQSGITFSGNRKGFAPVGSGVVVTVDWGADVDAGLIGEVTLTFARPLVGNLPVEFSLAPAEDPLRSGNDGFLDDGGPSGFQPINPTVYQSATGVIQGLSAVPEPSSFALVGLGILGLARRRHRS